MTTPGGNPASAAICANVHPTMGVFEAGLSTTVLPAATGPTVVPVKMARGKFHGGMTTPAPSGFSQDSLTSPGCPYTGTGSAIWTA